MTKGDGCDWDAGILSEPPGTIVGSGRTTMVWRLCSPTVRSRRKEALDRTLATLLKLGSSLMDGMCLAPDLPMIMCGFEI